MDGSWIALGLIAVIAVLTVSRMFRKQRSGRRKRGGDGRRGIPRHGDGGGAGGDNW